VLMLMYVIITYTLCGPEVFFKTCVTMKFDDDDDDDDDDLYHSMC